jgi:glyoxylase-like metal-dependent hydrolase (beta-lactamase superfamily II)
LPAIDAQSALAYAPPSHGAAGKKSVMTSHHAIHAIMVGLAPTWRPTGIMPCVRSDIGRDDPLPFIVWVIEGPDGVIVVDTGFSPDYIPEWEKDGFVEPAKLFPQIGLRPEQIKKVVVTHFHPDHFTGFDYFPGATFIVQRAEYEFWNGPMMRYDYLKSLMRPRVRTAVENLEKGGRFRLVTGDAEIAPGVKLLLGGGHTPGSQMVAVETPAGTAVLCGDIAYTYRNLRERLPVGWYMNLPDAVAALERAISTASRPELAFPSHDPAVMQGRRVRRVL